MDEQPQIWTWDFTRDSSWTRLTFDPAGNFGGYLDALMDVT